MPAPAAAGAVLVMDTSACALVVVDAVELLLFPFVSVVVEATMAVLLIVEAGAAEGDTCTTMVNVALVPAVSVAMLQLIVAPVVQVKVGPVVCVSETNVVFAGRVSVQATFAAFEGPELVTVMP